MRLNSEQINGDFRKEVNGPVPREAAAADSISESKATSWRTFLAVHPAADRIPDATEDEKRTLAIDLRRQAQRQPIIFVKVTTHPDARPQLLDGRTRLDLLSAAGIEVVDANGKVLIHHRTIEVANDAEAEGLSLSLNVHRRHLSAEQTRELIANLLKAKPDASNNAIAKQVKVDDKTVATVRRELEGRSEIPNVSTRTDTKGREQPANKTRKATKSQPTRKSDADAQAIRNNASRTVHAPMAEQKSEPRLVCDGIGASNVSDLQAQIDELQLEIRRRDFEIHDLRTQTEV